MRKCFIVRFSDVRARDAFLHALEDAHLRDASVRPGEFLPDIVFRDVAESVANRVKSLVASQRGQVFEDVKFDAIR